MISTTGRRILDFMREDPNAAVVFPSQVAVDYWAQALVLDFDAACVRLDRLVSWDHFKEEVFHGDQDERPANILVRSLFAESFLARNAENPILRRVLPREYAREYQGFVSTLVRMVAGLGLLFSDQRSSERDKRLSEAIKASSNPDLWQDWGLIYEAYRGFLIENRYYEPRWLATREPHCPRGYLIVFPQVLEDWVEYQPLLAKIPGVMVWPEKNGPVLAQGLTPENHPGPVEDGRSSDGFSMSNDSQAPENSTLSAEVSRSPAGKGAFTPHSLDSHSSSPLKTLPVFPNIAEEIGAALDEVEANLDRGTAPEDIVITLAGYDGALDELMKEGRRRGLPLCPKRGRSLTEFPGPRLFTQVAGWLQADGSFETTQGLFKNCQVPWLRSDVPDTILKIGVEANLGLTNMSSWFWALGQRRFYSKSEIEGRYHEGVYRWFSDLNTSLNRLSRASSFTQLREYLEVFLSRFINPEGWSPEAEAALQRSRELLNDLAQTESELGLGVPGPFLFWLARLESSTYVPQNSQEGISVFPYRVAAGIPVKSHLVLNMNQEDVTVTSGGLEFLREDQIQLLEEGLYRNMTEDFLYLYSVSGREVYLSGSRQNSDGHRLPPGLFIARGLTQQHNWFAPDSASRVAYLPEQTGFLFWQAMKGAKNPLSPAPREVLHPTIHRRTRETGGSLRISNAQIELYNRCPLAYLIRYGVGIHQEDWQPELSSPRIEGTLYHRVFEEFFRWIREQDHGIIDATRVESHYLPLIRNTAEQVLASGLPPGQAALLRPEFLENCELVLRQDALRFDRFRVAQPEAEWVQQTSYSLLPQGVEVTLSGRIDSVLLHPRTGGAVVIDYKRSLASRHGPAAIRGNLFSEGDSNARGQGNDSEDRDSDESVSDESPGSENLQLPVYALLVAPPESLCQPHGPIRPPEHPSVEVPGLDALVYLGFRGDTHYRLIYDVNPESQPPTIPVLEGERSPFSGRKDYRPLSGLQELERVQGYVLSQVEKLCQGITTGVFDPPTDQGCDSCMFRGICRKKFGLHFQAAKGKKHEPV